MGLTIAVAGALAAGIVVLVVSHKISLAGILAEVAVLEGKIKAGIGVAEADVKAAIAAIKAKL
jgi:hypothetical protein